MDVADDSGKLNEGKNREEGGAEPEGDEISFDCRAIDDDAGGWNLPRTRFFIFYDAKTEKRAFTLTQDDAPWQLLALEPWAVSVEVERSGLGEERPFGWERSEVERIGDASAANPEYA